MGPDYNVIGHIDMTMDGVETRYLVFTQPDQGRSFASIKNLDLENGMVRIPITGVTPREDGH